MKKVQFFVASILAVYSLNATAQIPVTDGAHIASSNLQHLEEIAKYVEQIEKMVTQIETLQAQLDAMTGNRGFGTPNTLPSGIPTDLLNILKGNTTQAAEDLYEADKIFERCKNFVGREKSICEQQAKLPYQDYANLTDAYQIANQQAQNINEMIDKINQTQDPKAIAELQARIQAESALLQNEANQISIYQQQMAAKKAMEAEKGKQIISESVSRPFSDYKPGQL